MKVIRSQVRAFLGYAEVGSPQSNSVLRFTNTENKELFSIEMPAWVLVSLLRGNGQTVDMVQPVPDPNPLTADYRPSPGSAQANAITVLSNKLRNPSGQDGLEAFEWGEDLAAGAAQALVEELIWNWAQATIESPATYTPASLLADLHSAIDTLQDWAGRAKVILEEANQKAQGD